MRERPLRKYIRYRDQAGKTLEEHTAHWRGFTWEAGPVIVLHDEAPWGQVKVWAVSIAEGKRVIRHAGVIAGVNPDTQGIWSIHSSSNPRFGQTGTMMTRYLGNGAVAVTKRSGPSGLPEVVEPSLDS
jgi:hypothetical protein